MLNVTTTTYSAPITIANVEEVLKKTLPAEKFELSERIQDFCIGKTNLIFHANEITWLQDVVNSFKAHKIDPVSTHKLQNIVDQLFHGEQKNCPEEYTHLDVIEKVLPELPLESLSAFSCVTEGLKEITTPFKLKTQLLIASINEGNQSYSTYAELQADLTKVGKAITHLNLPKIISMDLITTEDELISLMKKCPSLTHLNLRGCTPVTAPMVYSIIYDICPDLVELNIRDCPLYKPTPENILENHLKMLLRLTNFQHNGGGICNGTMPFWGYMF